MPEAVRAFAPGRVNLIGEHTDYNDGLCLPFAIERGVTVAAVPLPGRQIEVRALDLREEDRFAVDAVRRAEGWRAFARGAVAELRLAGIEPRPCRLDLAGDVPRGSGLGSSAALGVSLCLALCAVAGAEPPGRLELARLCSRIESEWCGARTGLLDQLAALFGESGRALLIDVRESRIEPVPLRLAGHSLATLDSGAPRRLAASGYNERRDECRRAAFALGLRSLRDADAAAVERLPERLRRRARHVLSENERVKRAVAALRRGEAAALGRLLDASHASLRDDYEVSTPEVERALRSCRDSGAIGGRVVGGGFGGSVLALFPPGTAPPPAATRVEPGPAARLI